MYSALELDTQKLQHRVFARVHSRLNVRHIPRRGLPVSAILQESHVDEKSFLRRNDYMSSLLPADGLVCPRTRMINAGINSHSPW